MKRKSIYDIALEKANRGDLDGAKKIFKELLKRNKKDTRALDGLSTGCLISEDYEESLIYTEQLIAVAPFEAELQKRKIIACLQLLKIEDAIESIEALKRIDPSHPDIKNFEMELCHLQQDQKYQHLEYIKNRFDNNAASYDKGRESVQYDAPKLLLRSINNIYQGNLKKVLDLGCGTGLSGTYLREKSEHLIGVDVSNEMLQIAENKKIYDELINKDITKYLDEQQENSFDAIVAASVVIYFGDLNNLFKNIKRTLTPKGIFAFDILTQKFGNWSSISSNGRIFKHNPDYINQEIISEGMVSDYFYTSTFKYITADNTDPGAIFTVIKN